VDTNGRTIFGPSHRSFGPIAFKRLYVEELNIALEQARTIYAGAECRHVWRALIENCDNYDEKKDTAIRRIIIDAAEKAATLAAYEQHGELERIAGDKAADRDECAFQSTFCLLTSTYMDELEAAYPAAWYGSERKEVTVKHWLAFRKIAVELGSTGYGTTLQSEVEQRFEAFIADLHAARAADLERHNIKIDQWRAEQEAATARRNADKLAFEAQVERAFKEIHWEPIDEEDWGAHEAAKGCYGARVFHEAWRRHERDRAQTGA
jgi:hypothetical protein